MSALESRQEPTPCNVCSHPHGLLICEVANVAEGVPCGCSGPVQSSLNALRWLERQREVTVVVARGLVTVIVSTTTGEGASILEAVLDYLKKRNARPERKGNEPMFIKLKKTGEVVQVQGDAPKAQGDAFRAWGPVPLRDGKPIVEDEPVEKGCKLEEGPDGARSFTCRRGSSSRPFSPGARERFFQFNPDIHEILS